MHGDEAPLAASETWPHDIIAAEFRARREIYYNLITGSFNINDRRGADN